MSTVVCKVRPVQLLRAIGAAGVTGDDTVVITYRPKFSMLRIEAGTSHSIGFCGFVPFCECPATGGGWVFSANHAELVAALENLTYKEWVALDGDNGLLITNTHTSKLETAQVGGQKWVPNYKPLPLDHVHQVRYHVTVRTMDAYDVIEWARGIEDCSTRKRIIDAVNAMMTLDRTLRMCVTDDNIHLEVAVPQRPGEEWWNILRYIYVIDLPADVSLAIRLREGAITPQQYRLMQLESRGVDNLTDSELSELYSLRLAALGDTLDPYAWMAIPAPENLTTPEQVAEWLESEEGKYWRDAQTVLNPIACEAVHASGLWYDTLTYWAAYCIITPETAQITTY
ncbi:MAG: hypothetical protein KatS3mg038_3730 [Candidatus Kapaibacterium sp.]|nr:MAG: hypothetical protein KatS3mg038_2332 [Candidatus Kapabacteria bacterium]GIV53209.1 MAG: hypothetical protein KatS3mg038_3730 [Candidatus Kapabacteria bacterium]